jgi:hypothetical protein
LQSGQEKYEMLRWDQHFRPFILNHPKFKNKIGPCQFFFVKKDVIDMAIEDIFFVPSQCQKY